MVRIQRNDAPPRPKINLVSDEDNSSSSSSSSTHSSSSSEREVQPTPSPLSDFIEENDEPQPLPKSSSSSWEPVKRRRKRISTLRRKPKLNDIDADEEESMSTASTSSDGIPTPDVAADADEEEDYVQHPAPPTPPPPPPPVRTPSKRRRPRRTAAPRCFLDALNKYVEPMSKEAMHYTQRTIREIWHDQSDKESQGDVSDDSSLEYVPHQPEEETGDAAEDATDNDNQDGASSTAGVPLRRRPVRSTDSYRNESSHMVHSDEENAGERAKPTARQNNYGPPVQYAPCPQSESRRFLLDLSDTDEENALPTDLKQKQKSLNDPGKIVAAAPQSELIDLVEKATPISRQQKRENVVIDLCSDGEYVIPNASADELDDPNVEIIRSPGNCIEDELQYDRNTTERNEQKPAQHILEKDRDDDQHGCCDESTSIIKTEASDCLRKRNACPISACDENPPPSVIPHRVVMHERNARLAVSLPQTQSPQTESDSPVTDNLIESNAIFKTESSPQMHTVEGDTDYNIHPRDKDCVRKWEDKELRHTDREWKSGQAQTCQTSPFCKNLIASHSNMTSHGLRESHLPREKKRNRRDLSTHHGSKKAYGQSWKRRRNR